MLGLALMGGIDGKIRKILNGSIKKEIPVKDEGVGSNGFAFNASKTQDGFTYLGINSHQPIEGLLSFYEMHICSEEGWNIVGAMFHGSPVIFEGTNEYLGWGHTTGDVDNADYFQLEMHPKKKNLYKIDDEWKKLEQKKGEVGGGIGQKEKVSHTRLEKNLGERIRANPGDGARNFCNSHARTHGSHSR